MLCVIFFAFHYPATALLHPCTPHWKAIKVTYVTARGFGHGPAKPGSRAPAQIRTGCGCNFKWNSHCNGQRKNCIKRPRKVLVVWEGVCGRDMGWGRGRGRGWLCICLISRTPGIGIGIAGATGRHSPRYICLTIMSGNYRIGRNLHYTLRNVAMSRVECDGDLGRVATVCKQCAIFYQLQQQQ